LYRYLDLLCNITSLSLKSTPDKYWWEAWQWHSRI